ncbi:MAG TPA: hypothetical protein VE982_03500 [Gaiellaceae bacterium]|nr:hypothetical protein [Gaiellaceae bacterium]
MDDALDELRAVAAATRPEPGMEDYLRKVRERAYTIADGDVEALRAAGFEEDEIFRQTVAAAIAEGLRRLDAARRVIG